MEFRTNKLHDISDENRLKKILQLKSGISAMQALGGAPLQLSEEALAAVDARFATYRQFRHPYAPLRVDLAVPVYRALCCAWMSRYLAVRPVEIPVGDAKEQKRAAEFFRDLQERTHPEPLLDATSMRRFDKHAPRFERARMTYLGHATLSTDKRDDPMAIWQAMEELMRHPDGVYLAYFSGADLRKRSPRFGMATAHYAAFRTNEHMMAYLEPTLGGYAFEGDDALEFLDFFVEAHAPHVGVHHRVDLVHYAVG